MAKSGFRPLDLMNVPGTTTEQRSKARSMLARRQAPIVVSKAGSVGWNIDVLGVSIGKVKTKDLACSAAHQVGRYRLDMGDFVHSYTKGCARPGEREQFYGARRRRKRKR